MPETNKTPLGCKLFVCGVLLLILLVVWFMRAWSEDLLEEQLVSAAGQGDLTTVKLLVNIGVDINGPHVEGGGPPLWAARANNHDDIVKYLLDHHADPEAPPYPRGQ